MAIYKYGSADRVDVLKHSRIRFTQATALNDPFEVRPYFEKFGVEGEVLARLNEGVDITSHLREAYEESEELKSSFTFEQLTNVLNGVLESQEGQRIVQETLNWGLGLLERITPAVREKLCEGLGNKVAILSFGTVPDNVQMWSHYADEHRGIVLAFDERHPWFDRRRGDSDEFYHLRTVIYEAPKSDTVLMTLDGTEVFLRKDPKWGYEMEVRMLAPAEFADETVDHSDNAVHLFNVDPNAIVGVIFGARSSTQTRSEFASLKADDPRYKHLELSEAVLNEKDRTIRIVPYHPS